MRKLFLTVVVLLSACTSSDGGIVISGLEITRPMPGSGMSAGYFTLTNSSSETVVIDRVGSPSYGKVEMHETRLENGVSRMRPLPNIEVEAREKIVFERGGKHLMLMRPQGSADQVELRFFSGEELLLIVTARVNQ